MIKQRLWVARLITNVAVTLAIIGGSHGTAQKRRTNLTCDDSLKSVFEHNRLVDVTLIRFFQKGDPLLLSGTAISSTPLAANNMCMVKLTVGPGNPGPPTAPSTSAGIGIEIWLPDPANWNGRVHVLGGAGWGGGEQTSSTAFGQSGIITINAWDVAGAEGAVSATTDTGHTVNDGTFAMNPDGTINTVLWNDYSRRSLHEMAVQTKVLARAYYGAAPRFSYWHGGSTGGRQGIKEAQDYPEDFDGIVAGMPATNFTNVETAEMYPQIVIQRDLGGEYLTSAQLTAVSMAAISACDIVGGHHLGYIPEPQLCKYDPTIDPAVLCWTNGGSNTTASCVTPRQAEVFNKVWYGQTSDGAAPSPATDNGFGSTAAGNRRWYGLTRGTNLNFLLGPTAFSSDMIALEMQDPSLGSPTFVNATGDGTDRWKNLTYYQLSEAFDRGVALQIPFAEINTDNTDLSGLRERGGKLLTYHGLADYLIFPQGSIEYYAKVIARMDGLSDVQTFFRLYLVPGLGHFPNQPNGNANMLVNPPLPTDLQWYSLITDWVEKGIAPDRVVVTSAVDSNNPVQKSRPLCLYPLKAVYSGGDPNQAGSYVCSR